MSFIDMEQTAVQEIAAAQSQDETEITLKVAAVKSSIMKLPDGYRTVISLYLLEGYDHEEIAGILQVAESTVRSQYIRAKQKLLHLLNKEYEQTGKIY